MLTVNELTEFGANTKEGLARCMNKEAFYLRLVGKAVMNDAFEKLAEAVASGDDNAGFEAAHQLKGLLANLSLTPILDPVTELTEMLRHSLPGDREGLLKTVLEKRDELKAKL